MRSMTAQPRKLRPRSIGFCSILKSRLKRPTLLPHSNTSAKNRRSVSDCLVLESARKVNHLPLGTFDKSLARLSGATLIR